MIKVMLSAGEVSGDIHGAALAKELKILNRNIILFGMGGERMRSAGVELLYDLSSRGTVGIIEILKFLPSILFGISKMKRALKKEQPDLLVLIDYQGFNMMLAKYAKKLGIKTVYYIAPQEWLWGTPKGVKNVANTIDKILCIFEDEAKTYKKYGGNAVYIGNPNVDTTKSIISKAGPIPLPIGSSPLVNTTFNFFLKCFPRYSNFLPRFNAFSLLTLAVFP